MENNNFDGSRFDFSSYIEMMEFPIPRKEILKQWNDIRQELKTNSKIEGRILFFGTAGEVNYDKSFEEMFKLNK